MTTIRAAIRQAGAADTWLSDASLRGRTVIAAEGLVIGEVTALFFDPGAWRVESLRVKLRNEIADRIGVHRSVFRAGALEIPARLIQAVGDTVVLAITADELREVLGSGEQAPSIPPEGTDVDP